MNLLMWQHYGWVSVFVARSLEIEDFNVFLILFLVNREVKVGLALNLLQGVIRKSSAVFFCYLLLEA